MPSVLRCAIVGAAAVALAVGGSVTPAAAQTDEISVVSFNIQFLGSSSKRDNEALTDMLADFDLVFVQEVIAPPYDGEFPDGDPYRPDAQVTEFFDQMQAHGFDYFLSPEDTGPGVRNHSNGTNTEYWVAFYKANRVELATDLPLGFIADDVTRNPNYDRVPFAFPFRAGSEDLVFISVHLRPGAGPAHRARRAHELDSIWRWIRNRSGSERDYVILGDMNIENCTELAAVLPQNAISMNGGCDATNTNVNSPKPYDHVMFRSQFTDAEIPGQMEIVDLIEEMRGDWPGPSSYPGDPYQHNRFRAAYSDHHPIVFTVVVDSEDND